MRNLKKGKADQRKEEPSPAKWKKIQERAGELAVNHGERADAPDERDMRRAKRELLDMEITSPKVAKGPTRDDG